MSFILDALKKAEEEKNAGNSHDPIAQLGAPLPMPVARRSTLDAQQRRMMAIGAGAVLLLLVVACIIWLLPARKVTTPAVVAQAPQAQLADNPAIDAPADATADSESEAGTAVFLDAPEPTANPEDAGMAASNLDDLIGEEELAEEVAPEAAEAPVAEAPASPPVAKVRPQPKAVAAAPKSPEQKPAVETAPDEEELSPEALAVLSKPAKPRSKPAPQGATRLADMPPVFRSKFPPLNVDVHYYNDNPLRRFVIINGRKYRETDTLVEGPKIVEITVGGVVLDQSGTRIIRGIAR